MKKVILKTFAVLAFLTIPVLTSMADDPDGPPNPGGDPGVGGGQPVGAPIDGGLSTLLLLGAAYGSYKLYKNRDREAEI